MAEQTSSKLRYCSSGSGSDRAFDARRPHYREQQSRRSASQYLLVGGRYPSRTSAAAIAAVEFNLERKEKTQCVTTASTT